MQHPARAAFGVGEKDITPEYLKPNQAAEKMKDGSVKTFEQEAQPGWAAGNVVKVDGTTLTRQ